MTLCDAGPLIALFDKRDPSYARVRHAIDRVRLPLITTWPAFTEAAYFLHATGGWPLQHQLWDLVLADEVLSIHASSRHEQSRMQFLMEQYRDVPMDLADASLVAAAETLRLHDILTLDSDFRIYRIGDGGTFNIIPD